MSISLATDAVAINLAPSHDEIAQCARELWTESGQPDGRDDLIWYEAERRLISARRAPLVSAAVPRTQARQRSHERLTSSAVLAPTGRIHS